MKKILFAAILMTSAYAVSAQTNKGQWLAGGNVSFKSESDGPNDSQKSTTFQLSPDAGYFFIDNLAAGIRLNYEHFKVKSAPNANTLFFAGPFVRYYFLPKAQKLNIFADGSYGWGSNKYGTSQSINGYSFMAGPAFFVTPNTALEFSLGYQSLKYEGNSDRNNTFSVNVGFQIHLGSAKK